MGERTERFCDFGPMYGKRDYYPTGTSRHIDGRCLEPAIGTCIRCGKDYCWNHGAKTAISLRLSFGCSREWKIELCQECSEVLETNLKLTKGLERRFESLVKATSKFLAKTGKRRSIR